MAESRERYLDQYRDEIITLIRDRHYSKTRARQFLERKHDIEIPNSTFAAYCNRIPDLKEPPNSVPPEAEEFLQQYETYQTLIEGIKATTDLAAQIHGRMGVLEDAAAERHTQTLEAFRKLASEMNTALDQRHEIIVKGLQKLYDALPSREDIASAIKAETQGLETTDYRPMLTAIQEGQKQQARDITAIRRSVGPVWSMVQRNAPWMKAALFTGLFWLAVILGTMWYYKLWKYLPWNLPSIPMPRV
jgi:hypothetical protein